MSAIAWATVRRFDTSGSLTTPHIVVARPRRVWQNPARARCHAHTSGGWTMKLQAILATLFFALVISASRTLSAAPDPALVGTWTYKEPDGDTIKIVLNADGSGMSDTDKIT